MTDLLIRNIDATVAARLKRIAEERGSSVQKVARDILADATRESREDVVRRILERTARLTPTDDDSTDYIRAVRDGRIRG